MVVSLQVKKIQQPRKGLKIFNKIKSGVLMENCGNEILYE